MRVAPNRAAIPNAFAVELTKNGKPVTGADVVLDFDMLDMQMQQQSYKLAETRPGVYSRSAPALVMVGHWGLGFRSPRRAAEPFEALVVDQGARMRALALVAARGRGARARPGGARRRRPGERLPDHAAGLPALRRERRQGARADELAALLTDRRRRASRSRSP